MDVQPQPPLPKGPPPANVTRRARQAAGQGSGAENNVRPNTQPKQRKSKPQKHVDVGPRNSDHLTTAKSSSSQLENDIEGSRCAEQAGSDASAAPRKRQPTLLDMASVKRLQASTGAKPAAKDRPEDEPTASATGRKAQKADEPLNALSLLMRRSQASTSNPQPPGKDTNTCGQQGRASPASHSLAGDTPDIHSGAGPSSAKRKASAKAPSRKARKTQTSSSSATKSGSHNMVDPTDPSICSSASHGASNDSRPSSDQPQGTTSEAHSSRYPLRKRKASAAQPRRRLRRRSNSSSSSDEDLLDMSQDSDSNSDKGGQRKRETECKSASDMGDHNDDVSSPAVSSATLQRRKAWWSSFIQKRPGHTMAENAGAPASKQAQEVDRPKAACAGSVTQGSTSSLDTEPEQRQTCSFFDSKAGRTEQPSLGRKSGRMSLKRVRSAASKPAAYRNHDEDSDSGHSDESQPASNSDIDAGSGAGSDAGSVEGKRPSKRRSTRRRKDPKQALSDGTAAGPDRKDVKSSKNTIRSFMDAMLRSDNPKRQDTSKNTSAAVASKGTSASTDAAKDHAGIQTNAPAVPVCGMKNMGNTCYMNCVLQVLRHLPFDWKSVATHKDISHHPLLGRIMQLFGEMTAKEREIEAGNEAKAGKVNSTIDMKSFKELVDLVCPMFAGRIQHDAQEFFTYLVSAFDDLEHNLVARHLHMDMIFATRCLFCEALSYRTESEPSLSLPCTPFPASLNFLLGETLNSQEAMGGDNKYLCSECHARTEAHRMVRLSSSSRVLALHLNRNDATGFRKNPHHVQIPSILDVSSLRAMLRGQGPAARLVQGNARNMILSDRQEPLYHLRAVIFHTGATARSGHYTCCIRRWVRQDSAAEGQCRDKENADGRHPFADSAQWVDIDDDQVTLVTDEQMRARWDPCSASTTSVLLVFYVREDSLPSQPEFQETPPFQVQRAAPNAHTSKADD